MRILVFLLLLANVTLFLYIELDRVGGGEGARLSQQVQPDKIKLLTPQQVAALGPAKVAALADVCVEWGPLSETDRARAEAGLASLELGRLLTQRKVEAIGNYWVFLPPFPNKPAADKRVEELKAQGIRDVFAVDSGPQRFAVSLGVFRGEEAAQARLASLQAQGVKGAKVGQRAQAVPQIALVVRDPPAPVIVKLKELQTDFPGSELKIGSCEQTS